MEVGGGRRVRCSECDMDAGAYPNERSKTIRMIHVTMVSIYEYEIKPVLNNHFQSNPSADLLIVDKKSFRPFLIMYFLRNQA